MYYGFSFDQGNYTQKKSQVYYRDSKCQMDIAVYTTAGY